MLLTKTKKAVKIGLLVLRSWVTAWRNMIRRKTRKSRFGISIAKSQTLTLNVKNQFISFRFVFTSRKHNCDRSCSKQPIENILSKPALQYIY